MRNIEHFIAFVSIVLCALVGGRAFAADKKVNPSSVDSVSIKSIDIFFTDCYRIYDREFFDEIYDMFLHGSIQHHELTRCCFKEREKYLFIELFNSLNEISLGPNDVAPDEVKTNQGVNKLRPLWYHETNDPINTSAKIDFFFKDGSKSSAYFGASPYRLDYNHKRYDGWPVYSLLLRLSMAQLVDDEIDVGPADLPINHMANKLRDTFFKFVNEVDFYKALNKYE